MRSCGNNMRLNSKLIRALTIKNGWSISDLAEMTGLCRATVSRAMKGYEITPATVSKFYTALENNVELEELIDWGEG